MSRFGGTTVLAALLILAGVAAGQAPVSPANAAAQPVASEQSVVPAASGEANSAAGPEGAAPGDTHVRIVRLSDIKGKVTMDRAIGHGPEPTMQNMPIVQSAALATGEGYAEVEFEDGSTLRLAPNTGVRFPLLVLRSTGAKASTILVDRGTVYVSLEKAKDVEFTLTMGKARISVRPGTHLRLDMTGPKAELAVISGTASVEAEGGAPVEVGKKQTMTLDLAGAGQGEVAKGVYESAYDEWDKDAVKYHQRYMKTSANAGSTALYGVSDLNYYGSFVSNTCGGSFWQPYFVSAAWSPYSNGMWTLYSGGYSWVSPYPWGWLPFHTGSWSYCGGRGWGWRPGGSWYGLQNSFPATGIAGVRDPSSPHHPPGVVGGPHPPMRPPAGAKSFVMANSGPIVRSELKGADNFVFQKDSAGLGVPRGSLGNLHGISNQVDHHGFVSREVYGTPEMSSHHVGDGRPVSMPLSLHRGPAPEGLANGAGRFDWKNGQQGAPGTPAGQNRPTNNAPGGITNRPGGSDGAFHGGGGQPGGWNSGGGQAGGNNGGSFHGGGGSPGGNMGGGGGSFHGGGGGAPAGGGGGGASHGGGGAPAGGAPGGGGSHK
jgi:hypothetical protein